MTNVSNGASPEQLEREIAETRSAIDNTLAAIQDKLSPGQILDQALGHMRRNGGEFAGNVGRSVRDNPVPLALVGIGLSWLMMSGNRAGTGADPEDTVGTESGDNIGRIKQFGADTAERASEAAESFKHKAGDVASDAQDRMQRATDTARHYGEVAKETYEEGRDRAASLVHRAAKGANRAQENAGRFMHDHPLVVGAVAVAAGAVLAALVPTTRREGELLGEQAGQARKAVRENAEEAFDSARKVARAARAGAKKEADKDDSPHGEVGKAPRAHGSATAERDSR